MSDRSIMERLIGLDYDEDPNAPHLRIYGDRSVLYAADSQRVQVFPEGRTTAGAQLRLAAIRQQFADGFLQRVVLRCREGDVNFDRLTDEQKGILQRLEGAITSEVGRAVVGVAVLQLAIKAIEPGQSVRLHKAGRGQRFSWADGVPMRVIDEQFVTPVLREEDLLRVNKFGVMMTRSLAENYPYTVFYKADIRGAKGEWLQLVDLLETGEVNAESALQYMIYLLIKRSERFQSLASKVVELAKQKASSLKTPEDVLRLMTKHMANPSMPAARLLEITMHSLLQAVEEMRALGDTELRPLSQMRQANKKAGNLADVELATAGAVVEAWDAKFGKPYLYDELLELGDKLEQEMWATLEIVGFVTDQEPDLREDVRAQMEEIQNQFEIEVAILPLSDWVYRQVARVPSAERGSLAPKWLIAYAESLALHRTLKAPIDEPTEAWLEALEGMLS